MKKSSLIVNTDKNAQDLWKIINQDIIRIGSLERDDFYYRNIVYSNVLFGVHTKNEIKINIINKLKSMNCINKDTKIIYIDNFVK